MPYLTEVEYSNIQKKLGDREKLLEACKNGVKWLEECEGQLIEHDYGVPYDHIRIAEEELKQAISKAEGDIGK